MKTKKELLHLERVAKEAIDMAAKQGAILLVMIDGFQTDKEALILRDLLWYARLEEVIVQFMSPGKTSGKEIKSVMLETEKI